MTNPARAYLATQVETTTQGELLIMLYEAAIKFLKRAKVEIDNKDYAKKGIYISKAMAIIHELAESLNKEKGGDITPRLNQLYMFCTSQLIKANIRLDNKMVDDVIKILDGLRSAYAQIVPGHDGKKTPAQAATGLGPLPTIPNVPAMPKAPPLRPTSYAGMKPGQPQGMPTQPITQPIAPQPMAPQAAPQPMAQQAAPQLPAQDQETATPPAPPQAQPQQQPPVQAQETVQPPKLRSAVNTARLRAANAYNSNNR
ncbi:MAG: flagellar export chaperone FliS [Pseudodesulfovibrio sp.]|uniref:Flagellar protein FliS n=1 Tax=Pseudodesulfovibrio aespoeensis (strain ATCC 700646 / DSM 10631 / Aspo-2) TaxID=643562 RepID=E6VSW0_PSEA9|nr:MULTISPECIES: flagellar export chaperone FliS [Pseudodesulfovibrio]MBU4192489.1 flagellar export chaperone FliS [Pseudomonadota bacterium]ADU63204.1 flagellar protein FliS [Pseudodesulfovibrio aespoeensis Aspo-2]MBU4243268.1 flagellar export chaperone FliS [Pseudomonadota bacterium]MBU4379153.1 flagellar export chaperone FliS [Pseudomonadota bacterium]MBU4475101.1 flagellar export chaperone FliS [Pseudomonadota bacterium]